MTKPFVTRAMISILAVVAMSIAATSTSLSRPNTRKMTCSSAQALVAKNGGIVLGTGPSSFDRHAPEGYDRYVSSAAHCLPRQTTEPAFVPTIDYNACHIGHTCRESMW